MSICCKRKLRTNLSSHQNNLFCKSEFKILYSEIVFTQKKKENLGLKNKDIVKVKKKKKSFPFLLLKY